jgi:hypothetical protein
MRKALTALAAGGLIAATIVASVSDAQAQRRGRWIAPAIIGGIAAGALIGSAVAPRYYGYGEPVYVEPDVCYARERVWIEGRGWRWRRVAVPC